MIHKAYHPNGAPDLRNWIAQCDNRCPSTVALIQATQAGWFVGQRDNGRCYCPACIEVLAMCLISWTLTCPVCNSPELILGIREDGTSELILCNGECRTAYLAADGWRCACCGDPISLPDAYGD